MSVVSIPKVIDYSQPLETLPPDTVSYQQVCLPISGSSFKAGSQIDIDLGSRGFMVPNSLMIRYQMTTANAAACYMCGTPVYTPFLRLSTMINSTITENLNSYNVLSNFLCNLQMDVAQKLGVQSAYGFDTGGVTPETNEVLDGGTFGINGTKAVAAPLLCALSSSEKLIPLFALNGIRLTFTLDSIVNMFSVVNPDESSTTIARPTDFTITNFEVCYQVVDFGKEVEQMVLSRGDIRIKSQSFGTSVQNVASGTSGQVNLSYNLKYSSIKSLYLLCGGTTRTVSANGSFDAYDITTAGEYSYLVNGISYPQRPLSVLNNRSGILQSLRQAVGSIFDRNNSLSINTYEFLSQATEGALTSPIAPAKFYVGVQCDKLRLPSNAYFSGIPSGPSPITAIINITTATTQAYNCMLIAAVDYVFKIDPMTRQVVIIS